MKNNISNRRIPNLDGFNAVRVTKLNTVVRCIQHKEIVKKRVKKETSSLKFGHESAWKAGVAWTK
jgi:hypothetical protein